MSKKALIIEDEEVTLKKLAKMLEVQGLQVIEASTGNEGIEKAKSEKPDLIFSDVNLPDIDGFQMITTLRKEGSLEDTPFVFLTAERTFRDDMAEAMRMGAVDYLIKPVEEKDLKSVLKQMI